MLVLRSDISRKLSSVSLFLINLKIFGIKTDNNEYGKIWENGPGEIKTLLESSGVEIAGYRSSRKIPTKASDKLGIRSILFNGGSKSELFTKLGRHYSFKKTVIIGDEPGDIELIRLSGFSVTTANSPLELKMESDYVSNFSGIEVFEEVGNLILNAKKGNK